MLLEYQSSLRHQLPKQFLKKLRGSVYVQLINFQDPIHNLSYTGYVRFFTKPSEEPIYIWRILEYQIFLRYSTCFLLLKNLRTTTSVELSNFQSSIHKMNFNISYAKTVFNLSEMLVRINVWRFLQYQFPLRYYFPQQCLQNFRGTASAQLINFQDPIHKSDFDIYGPVTISNFPKKTSTKQIYVCSILDYQFPHRY